MAVRPSISAFGAMLMIGALLAPVQPADAQPRLPQAGPAPGSTAAPQDGPLLQGTTPELTAEMLRAAGYRNVTIYTSPAKTRHVRAQVDQVTMQAIHMHCRDEGCRSLAYNVSFGKQETITDSYMNSWNDERLFARLVRTKQGNLLLRQDVLMRDVPAVYIKTTAEMFANLVRQVLKYNPDEK